MNDLMQKLAISKQIMDRHKQMPRNQNQYDPSMSVSESVSSVSDTSTLPIDAKYSIPEEYLSPQQPKQMTMQAPVVTEDRIKNSKLPDAIKKLMIEHPIDKPQQYQATLSDDIIEGAARLMKKNGLVSETPTQKTTQKPQPQTKSNNSELKEMIREVLEEVLSENGLLYESSQKANEVVQIKVGKHIFEGKILKIKQTSK
jgi:hypothetical protein